jgi:hypothetical protein
MVYRTNATPRLAIIGAQFGDSLLFYAGPSKTFAVC